MWSLKIVTRASNMGLEDNFDKKFSIEPIVEVYQGFVAITFRTIENPNFSTSYINSNNILTITKTYEA